MKEKELHEEIEIPEEITVDLKGNGIEISGKKGKDERVFVDAKIRFELKDDKIMISSANASKREKTRIGSYKAHLRNMFKGVSEGHMYKLKICSGHFPMNVNVKGEKFVINNFLGEKVPRVLQIKKNANVKINGTEVVVESVNKEVAGQVAADIEQLCRITNRDRRIFQDGIYITEKDGKEI